MSSVQFGAFEHLTHVSYRRGVVSHGDGNDEDDVTTRQNEALLEEWERT